MGSESILPFEGSSTLVGVVSLFVGMLQAIINRLSFAKRAESHRIASLAYQKLYHHLDLQMSIPRKERQPALELVSFMKSETDRLAEIELGIPEQIKTDFHKRFGTLKDYSLPSVLNGLDEVKVYIEELKPIEELITPTPPPDQIEKPKITIERKPFR